MNKEFRAFIELVITMRVKQEENKKAKDCFTRTEANKAERVVDAEIKKLTSIYLLTI